MYTVQYFFWTLCDHVLDSYWTIVSEQYPKRVQTTQLSPKPFGHSLYNLVQHVSDKCSNVSEND